MKRKLVLTWFILICMTFIGMSQTTENVKPKGQSFAQIFSNFHSTYTDGESAPTFELSRLVLGYKYEFNQNFSALVCIDVGNPKNGELEFTAYARNAYVRYANGPLKVDFGVITGNSFNLQENFWGFRYVQKSYQDLFKYSASRDLGIKASYKVNDWLMADALIVNGEGYKKVQKDSVMRYGVGATLYPVKKLIARAYYDIIDREETQQTLALFTGYSFDKASVGFEYNQMSNTKFVKGNDQSGISTYGRVNAGDHFKIFARYDHRMSDNDWNLADDGDLYTLGFEYMPVKGVKFSPNFSGWNPKDPSQSFTSTVYFSCEFKF